LPVGIGASLGTPSGRVVVLRRRIRRACGDTVASERHQRYYVAAGSIDLGTRHEVRRASVPLYGVPSPVQRAGTRRCTVMKRETATDRSVRSSCAFQFIEHNATSYTSLP